MEEKKYRIGELAELAKVTRRTVHYYLSRGLLPPSEGAGLATTYSDEHLYRIKLIKKYQDDFLPLDEIKKRIKPLSLKQVKERLENDIEEQNFIIYEEPVFYTEDNVYKKVILEHEVEIYYPMGNVKSRELVDRIVNEFIKR